MSADANTKMVADTKNVGFVATKQQAGCVRSQVASAEFFSTLGYSTCWEDPRVTRRALDVRSTDSVLSITSGGDVTLALLLDSPREIVSVDLNPIQNHLLELKMACFRKLTHAGMLAFLGIRPSSRRWQTFEYLKPVLSETAARYWTDHRPMIEKGVLNQGRQDRYLFLFGRLLRVIVGADRVRRLLGASAPSDQQRIFDKQWNGRRWRWIFDFFFSRGVMSLAMDRAHFDQVDERCFGPLIRERVDHVLRDLSAQENCFLNWALTQTYPTRACVPDYLDEAHFDTIRRRLERITIVTEEVETFLRLQRAGRFGRFNFSNIFDWVADPVFPILLAEIARIAQPGARMCYYNLIRKLAVPTSVPSFVRLRERACTLLAANRAMGYTNFELYEINGG